MELFRNSFLLTEKNLCVWKSRQNFYCLHLKFFFLFDTESYYLDSFGWLLWLSFDWWIWNGRYYFVLFLKQLVPYFIVMTSKNDLTFLDIFSENWQCRCTFQNFSFSSKYIYLFKSVSFESTSFCTEIFLLKVLLLKVVDFS